MINWDASGAIAETLGAIGVVATLIYLARQFRQSLLDADAEANITLGREYLNHQATVISDENVGAFVKGLELFSSLSPEERAKFSFCATGYVNVVEELPPLRKIRIQIPCSAQDVQICSEIFGCVGPEKKPYR